MENNDLLFCENIYLEHLSTINNVKFTPREIDVMACLLSARRTSQIASILSIAPRTVTTHFRNIMLRLDCNSQEGIINFIERSHKLSILREYYSTLIIELAFKKALKEISKLRKDEIPFCLIVYWQDQGLKNAFMHHLENHLLQAGILTEIREQEIDHKLENCENQNHILVLLIEKRDAPNIVRELADHKFIDLSEHHNFYLAVFDILQELLPNPDLKSVFKKFSEQYEVIHSVSRKKYSSAYMEEKFDINANWIIYKVLQTLKNRKKPYILAFAVICLFAAGALILKGNKEEGQNHIQVQNTAKEPTIRSDLVVPAETALLHRPELISQIDEKFKGQNEIQTVALVGPGGAGKTTLSRQYAQQQKAHVIWEINAETNESLKESFENLSGALAKTENDQKIFREIQNIKNPRERERKVIQFVKERVKVHLNWFLLFDNVEKFTDIQKYFPQDSSTWGRGKIILTTRDSNIENNKHVNHVIQVKELNSAEKLNLFMKIIGIENTSLFTPVQKEKTKKFLEEIPPFPLDVSIAAYYLKATNITYQKYLESLVTYNKDFADVQQNLLKEAGDYTKTRYSIIVLSILHLIKTQKDFGDLLLFISLLDSQNIPRELLNTYKNNTIVDNFIYNLKKFSLINKSSHCLDLSLAFSIHRSTQEIILAYLTKTLDLERNFQFLQSITNTLEKYITDAIENEDCSKTMFLINHFEKFLTHKNLLTHNMMGAIKGELGCAYYYLGNLLKAKELLEEHLSKISKSDSKNQGQIARALVYLGNVYRELGDYEKAKKVIEQSLVIYKNPLYENHIGTARALGNLGNVYRNLGDYKKAERFLEQSFTIYKKYFSEDHAGVAQILVYLGVVSRAQGEYDKAKRLLEKSLTIYKKHFSENHVDIAWALAYLGTVYREQGEYEKAKNLLEQSLIIYKMHFSETSSDIAWALGHLGNVYRNLGYYEKAEKFLEQSLTIYKKHISANNVNNVKVALILAALENIWREQGNYEKAKSLGSNLTTYEKFYGTIHMKDGRTLQDLGGVYLLRNHLKTAEILIKKALDIFQKNKNPERHMCLEALAELYLKKSIQAMNEENKNKSQNFKIKAVSYLRQALEIVKAHFSEDSPHIIRIQTKLNNIK